MMSNAWGSVIFSGREKNMPKGIKKVFDRIKAEATNLEFQKAKRIWAEECEKMIKNNISGKFPKMPKFEDFV